MEPRAYDLGIPADEIQARFDGLQMRLVPLWKSIRSFNQHEQTIVVVPSMTVDKALDGPLLKAYEERFLFLLFLLRQPRARLIYVTAQAIDPVVVDYYLHLLPGVIASHARKRLHLVAVHDASPRPLSLKLLERPGLLRRIRELIPDPDRAHLVPFNTTNLERDLALALDVPMYAADPRHFPLGTKSGCRRLFAEEGVNHPIGIEALDGIDAAAQAIASLRARKPGVREVVVKLNEGVSGEGNGFVRLDGLPAPGSPAESSEIRRRLPAMKFESPDATFDAYARKLAERGGIVEERIVGDEIRSPSVQMRVTPLGEVEVLSTHDQILGGAEGQSYLGCRFPADRAYAPAIVREALKVGRRLAKEGVLGRFALDFVVSRTGDEPWEAHAIEINLRKGGTTHPFLTLQFLTDGRYDPETAVFTTALGKPKCFVASDHLCSPLYRAFTPDDLFDVVARHGLHFDQSRQTGIVLHMLGALGETGLLGLTAVGDDHAHADAIYQRAVAALDEEAAAALR